MVYAIGVAGFISGFLFGQMVLYFLLRHRSREDLLHDRHLKMQYGILNWVIAALGGGIGSREDGRCRDDL